VKPTEQHSGGRKYRDIPVLGRVLRAKDTVKRMYMVWKMQREARKALQGMTDMDAVLDEVKNSDEQ